MLFLVLHTKEPIQLAKWNETKKTRTTYSETCLRSVSSLVYDDFGLICRPQVFEEKSNKPNRTHVRYFNYA